MFTCVETFAGAGGMALGLREAGYELKYAFDIEKSAVDTYRENIADHAHVRDIRLVSGNDILGEIGLSELDVLSGGPPCQGFSKQKRGAHLNNDDRNDLVREYARLIDEIKPKAFIFENVQIFGQKRGRELIEFMEEKLSNYNIFRFFTVASDFGLAQRRTRFVMIGIRRDVSNGIPVLAGESVRRTVKDEISHFPPPPDDYREHPNVPNHIKCRITKLNEERFRHVPQGGGWIDIPEHLRLDCHKGVDTSKGGWPDVYGRLSWDGQAPTITAGFDSFTRGRYGHPEQDRSLTLREGARLQGFPDDFRFLGNRSEVRLQIGNAVPPPLATAIGNAIKRVLTGDNVVPEVPIWPEGISQLAAAE